MVRKMLVLVSVLFLLVLTVGSVSTVSAQTENYNLNVDAGPASAGGSVTLDVSADNILVIQLTDIPDNWVLQSSQDDGGILVRNDPDSDGHNESVIWAWETVATHNPSATLSIPSSAEKKDYQLTVEAMDTETETETVNISLGESIIDQYDTNNNNSIEGDEVRNAIRDFLFSGGISGSQIRQVIRAFLFGT